MEKKKKNHSSETIKFNVFCSHKKGIFYFDFHQGIESQNKEFHSLFMTWFLYDSSSIRYHLKAWISFILRCVDAYISNKTKKKKGEFDTFNGTKCKCTWKATQTISDACHLWHCSRNFRNLSKFGRKTKQNTNKWQ